MHYMSDFNFSFPSCINAACKIGKNKDNYCRDGGTCIPDADPNKPPTCMCAAGFSGFACQNPVPTTTSTTSQTTTESVACKLFPNFCANGGTCEPSGTKPACRCPPTHTGLQCKTPLGATPSQGPPVVPGQSTAAPVPGQSTAAPVPGQSTAAPVPGQSTAAPVPGQSTAAPVPGQSTAAPATRPTNLPPAGVRCDQNPCRNNRPCYNNGDSYFCSCGSQYRGINCEEFISG
ncbi:unnamed protein product [Rotaria socialis]|uniref:EGF-like domain-containing protein n=1 Tax=Rotaria socialis TaxID=392032 RepID=A0A817Z7L9_9BILA|nr:unnamed protein product [Rotaria socialis]CAF4492071.1 unnamed protein product [Rotaria socialis]